MKTTKITLLFAILLIVANIFLSVVYCNLRNDQPLLLTGMSAIILCFVFGLILKTDHEEKHLKVLMCLFVAISCFSFLFICFSFSENINKKLDIFEAGLLLFNWAFVGLALLYSIILFKKLFLKRNFHLLHFREVEKFFERIF